MFMEKLYTDAGIMAGYMANLNNRNQLVVAEYLQIGNVRRWSTIQNNLESWVILN